MLAVARHPHVIVPVGQGRLPVYWHRCSVCRISEYLGIRAFLSISEGILFLLSTLFRMLVFVTGPIALLVWSGVYSAGPTADLVWISLFGAYTITGSLWFLFSLLNRIQLPVCLDRWTFMFVALSVASGEGGLWCFVAVVVSRSSYGC